MPLPTKKIVTFIPRKNSSSDDEKKKVPEKPIPNKIDRSVLEAAQKMAFA